jgi:hypothetical protein
VGSFFTGDEVKPPPERTLLLPGDDISNLFESLFIVALQSQSHLLGKMLVLKPPSMFLVEFTLSFAFLDPQ